MIDSIVAKVLANLVPNEAGVLWFALLVFACVFGDLRNLRSNRNLALLALWVPSGLFLGYVSLPEKSYAPHVFGAIYLMTAGMAGWSLYLAFRPSKVEWKTLDLRALLALFALVLLFDAVTLFGLRPDDAGIYTNLGARRWLETGIIPYADDLLKGPTSPAYGAAATYGPALYIAHMPFQFLVGTTANAASLDPMNPAYVRPPDLASQLTCFSFFGLSLFCLFRILRELKGSRLALGAVIVFCASPLIVGLGGTEFRAGGLLYVSHIAPSATMLAALYLRRRPELSGALLGVAAALLFFPAFTLPVWLGWWWWRDRAGALRFLLGFCAVGLMTLAIVVGFSQVEPGESAVRLFLESTLEHQEGTSTKEYGNSAHSFWGTHPVLADIFHRPILGDTSLFKPTFLAFAALSVASFFFARGRTVAQFAALVALLTSAIQLWKTHANGTYVAWYFGFFLVALIGGNSTRSEHDPES